MKLQIVSWETHLESNKSKIIVECKYSQIPNNQGGLSLAHLLSHPDGLAAYGIFILMAGVCSAQRPPRMGFLTEDGTPNGRPIDFDDLCVRWRREKPEIERLVALLMSPKVAWIRDLDQDPAQSGADPAPIRRDLPNSAGPPRTEGLIDRKTDRRSNDRKSPDDPPPLRLVSDLPPEKPSAKQPRFNRQDAEKIYAAYPRKIGHAAAITSIERAISAVAKRAIPDPVAWLLAQTVSYAKTRAGQDPTFTPHPTTWFNQGRYDDEAAPTAPPPDEDEGYVSSPVSIDRIRQDFPEWFITLEQWEARIAAGETLPEELVEDFAEAKRRREAAQRKTAHG